MAAQLVAAWGTCGGARPVLSRWGGSGVFSPVGTETSAGRQQDTHSPIPYFPSSPLGSAIPHVGGCLLGCSLSPP